MGLGEGGHGRIFPELVGVYGLEHHATHHRRCRRTRRSPTTMREPFIRSLVLERELIDEQRLPVLDPGDRAARPSSSSTRRSPSCRRQRRRQVDADRGDRGRVRLQRRGRQPQLQRSRRERSESELGDVLRLVRGARRPRTDFFLRAESYFNVATEIERLDREPAPAVRSSRTTAASRCTSSRTASRSSRCSSTGSGPTGSTSSTSPRPRSRRSASSRCSRACTSSSPRARSSSSRRTRRS